jgi:hypothetical protein
VTQIDAATYAAKLEARYRVQFTRQAEEISRLVVEVAQLEAYIADQQQIQSDQPPDPWGDDTEKGPQ